MCQRRTKPNHDFGSVVVCVLISLFSVFSSFFSLARPPVRFDSFMKTKAMNLLFFADNTSTVPRSVWQQILLIVSLFTSILSNKPETLLVVHCSIDWIPCSIVFSCCCCCCSLSWLLRCYRDVRQCMGILWNDSKRIHTHTHFVYNFVNASVKIVDWGMRYICTWNFVRNL